MLLGSGVRRARSVVVAADGGRGLRMLRRVCALRCGLSLLLLLLSSESRGTASTSVDMADGPKVPQLVLLRDEPARVSSSVANPNRTVHDSTHSFSLSPLPSSLSLSRWPSPPSAFHLANLSMSSVK